MCYAAKRLGLKRTMQKITQMYCGMRYMLYSYVFHPNTENNHSPRLATECQRRWLMPKATDHPGYSTPYDHMKLAWWIARPTAMTEKSDSGFYFPPDGQSFDTRDSNNRFHNISFSTLGGLSTRIANDTKVLIQKSLPTGCEHILQEFDIGKLTDNLADPRSIFEQESNKKWLNSIKETLRTHLFVPGEDRHCIVSRNGELSVQAANKWISYEDTILSHLLTHFALTCGVAPREWQIKNLLFDSVGTTWRNMFILDGALCVGNPEAKQVGQYTAECLWACTSMIAPLFLFEMAVMRPIVTEVLDMLHADVRYRDTHIFVHSFPKARPADPHLFNGSDVNSSIQKLTSTLPIRLTCGYLRRFSTTLIAQLLPELLESGEPDTTPSIVDDQGQHQKGTGKTHYIQSLNVPAALQMSLKKARRYISLSQIYQAIFRLARVGEGWEGVLSKSHIFQQRKHEYLALKEAQSLVCIHYGIGGRDRSQIQEIVRDILDRQPYIAEHEV
jgi:hypothetical protein